MPNGAKMCCYCKEYAYFCQMHDSYKIWYRYCDNEWWWYKYIDYNKSSQPVYRKMYNGKYN